MKALARLPSPEGIAAMQSINIVVINRSFLGAFFGTALLSLGMVLFAVQNWESPSAYFFVAGAVSYVLGTLLVTMFGNVPLNNKLAATKSSEPDGDIVWKHYVDRWTILNTVRTVAAMIAALLYTAGLLQTGVA